MFPEHVVMASVHVAAIPGQALPHHGTIDENLATGENCSENCLY